MKLSYSATGNGVRSLQAANVVVGNSLQRSHFSAESALTSAHATAFECVLVRPFNSWVSYSEVKWLVIPN